MTSSSCTVCNKMWDSVFINVKGEVFFCCRREPDLIGNIYDRTLAEIWNGRRARSFRALSMEGGLGCQPNCNMLSRAEKARSPDDLRSEAPPIRKVHIEHHEFCNIGCIMCYQLHIKNRKHLPNQLLYDHIDFSQVEEVQLQGGEPLAYKPCIQFFHTLIDTYRVPVTLQTNAVLINEQLADKIAANCWEIMIAMNAATKEIHEKVNERSDWDKVLHAIDLLQKAKQRHRSRLRIEGQMTMIRENVHELPDFIEFATKIGLDSISVSWEESVPDYLALHPDVFEKISRRIAQKNLLASKVFLKTKHRERLETLFDVGAYRPKLQRSQLPEIEQTGHYRARWDEDPRAAGTAPGGGIPV